MEADNLLTIELCDYLSTSDVQYIDKCYEKAIKVFECINIERYLNNKKVLKSLNCISTDGKDVD